MADTLTTQRRSELMSRVGKKNTAPELALRKILSKMGYRYRLHGRLPGTPDIVFNGRKKVIFVHGCFWHGHPCRPSNKPKSNVAYWQEKVERNQKRDRRTVRKLRRDGWSVLLVWECELKNGPRVARRVQRFLGETSIKVATREPDSATPHLGSRRAG